MRSYRHLISIMWLLWLSSAVAEAAMRCDRQWVDVGDSQYEVVSLCGEPVYQQVILEPVIAATATQLQLVRGDIERAPGTQLQSVEHSVEYLPVERWTYNPGHGRLLQELDFYNGRMIRIRTGSRAP